MPSFLTSYDTAFYVNIQTPIRPRIRAHYRKGSRGSRSPERVLPSLEQWMQQLKVTAIQAVVDTNKEGFKLIATRNIGVDEAIIFCEPDLVHSHRPDCCHQCFCPLYTDFQVHMSRELLLRKMP